jgi:hypothetical protein
MVFTLPGGYVDQHGTVHHEVELSALTGRDEEFLRSMAADTPSARVVTELLVRCIGRLGSLPAINENVARDMLVGDREYVVMRLFELTCGSTLNAVLRCPGEDCNKPMDVTLSLAEMAPERRPVAARYFQLRLSSEPFRHIEFRLPTGADQEELAGIDDEKRAVSALLARCTDLDESALDALPETARREIETEMEKLAPHADVEVEATCPECGRLFSGQAAWPTYCLGDMMSQSAGLERDVHLLAWHYHWSESDVLSMPRAKRRRYIDLIEEELNRAGEA